MLRKSLSLLRSQLHFTAEKLIYSTGSDLLQNQDLTPVPLTQTEL